MVDINNQHPNKDGSITVILSSLEEVQEFVECVNILNDEWLKISNSFLTNYKEKWYGTA